MAEEKPFGCLWLQFWVATLVGSVAAVGLGLYFLIFPHRDVETAELVVFVAGVVVFAAAVFVLGRKVFRITGGG